MSDHQQQQQSLNSSFSSPRSNFNPNRSSLLSTSNNNIINSSDINTSTGKQQQNKSKSKSKSPSKGKKKIRSMTNNNSSSSSDEYSDDDLTTLTKAAHGLDIKQLGGSYDPYIGLVGSDSNSYSAASTQSEDVEYIVRNSSSSIRNKLNNISNNNGGYSSVSSNVSTSRQSILHQPAVYDDPQLKREDSTSSTSSSSSSSTNNTPPTTSTLMIEPTPNKNLNFDTLTKLPSPTTPTLVPLQSPSQQSLQQTPTTIANRILNNVSIGGHEMDRSTPINFNVGGSLYATSLNTILKSGRQSLLFKIVEMQINVIIQDDTIFIDRNPIFFSCILDFLRTGRYCAPLGINTKALLMEAEFFKIDPLSDLIRDESELTRSDIINIINSCYDYPRFRGLWLCKLNLSGLDLSCALFEFANLSKSTIRSTHIQQANFVGTNLENCIFDSNYGNGCKFSNVKVSNATWTNNLLYESQCFTGNFKSTNFNGTSFACSDLSGTQFLNCNLEGCDFSHCDLTECNFTGSTFDKTSNLSCTITKDTIFGDNSNFELAIKKKNWKKPKVLRMKNKMTTIPGM